jgi:hypothetical protein
MSETQKVLPKFVLPATPEWAELERYARDAYRLWFGKDPVSVRVSHIPHEVYISIVVPEQTEEGECWDFARALEEGLEDCGVEAGVVILWAHRDEKTGRYITRPWRYPPGSVRPELVKDEPD